jgi:ribosomal protein L37AE/L43A
VTGGRGEKTGPWYEELRTLCARFGYRPTLSSAACSTLVPCSSVPMRKKTSSPRCRWNQAATSAAAVVWACPMCGASLT